MSKFFVPENYCNKLSLYETQSAIGYIKRSFEDNLKELLNLKRVSAPLIVHENSGLNDDLTGVERPVTFDTLDGNKSIQIVHSLAKWKRMALNDYNFPVGEGICTDMNAIRRDEIMDNTHSIYVDQWDWEVVINKEQRNLDFLKSTISKIMKAIVNTHDDIKKIFPMLNLELRDEIKFITTQELEDLYPDLTFEEREDAICKEYKTVFLMQIGDVLKSGEKHGSRAPDYDDWELNGDLIIWNNILGKAFEVSSMGIRVDSKSLDSQLTKADCDYRRNYEFHSLLLNDKLPLTIGGGIGQSRICMLLLEKAHIGEVQVSTWDDETMKLCKENNIIML